MPVPALTTTAGGPDSNSYVGLAEADGYFEARLDGEPWVAETPARRTQALLKAARRLDQFNWLGARADAVQALAWPRVGVPKRDNTGAVIDGGYQASCALPYGDVYRLDEVPQVVKDAQCELAFAYLNGFADGDEAEVKTLTDDKFSVTFDQPKQAGDLPAEVARLLSGLVNQHRRMRG